MRKLKQILCSIVVVMLVMVVFDAKDVAAKKHLKDELSPDNMGKVYHFVPNEMYPNEHEELDEYEIIYHGQYDEEGKPIPSTVYYQYFYVDENGVTISPTNDWYLVYDENPESLVKDLDVVFVHDNKEHTFKAHLYRLFVGAGDITINGHVLADVVCQPSGGGKNVDLTVNGHVTALKVMVAEDFFDFGGNVTVNGHIDYVYEEDYSWMTSKCFGSVINAGHIVVDGTINESRIKPLDDEYQGQGTYGRIPYVKRAHDKYGKETHGTNAAVNGDPLAIDVSTDGLTANTYPRVMEESEEVIAKVESILTEESKVSVMDISLIEDDKQEVQPNGEVELYFDSLSGFDNPAVYHVEDDGTIEKIPSNYEDGVLSCKTDSFSVYFIAEEQELLRSTLDEVLSGSTGSSPETSTVVVPQKPVEIEFESGDGTPMRWITSDGNNNISIAGTLTDIPSGAVFMCDEINWGTLYSKAEQAVRASKGDVRFVVYDMSLKAGDGSSISSFKGHVDVSMPIPDGFALEDGKTIVVYYLTPNGKLERCTTAVKDGFVTFATKHFSTYVYVEEAAIASQLSPKTGDEVLDYVMILLLGCSLVLFAGIKRAYTR